MIHVFAHVSENMQRFNKSYNLIKLNYSDMLSATFAIEVKRGKCMKIKLALKTMWL